MAGTETIDTLFIQQAISAGSPTYDPVQVLWSA